MQRKPLSSSVGLGILPESRIICIFVSDCHLKIAVAHCAAGGNISAPSSPARTLLSLYARAAADHGDHYPGCIEMTIVSFFLAVVLPCRCRRRRRSCCRSVHCYFGPIINDLLRSLPSPSSSSSLHFNYCHCGLWSERRRRRRKGRRRRRTEPFGRFKLGRSVNELFFFFHDEPLLVLLRRLRLNTAERPPNPTPL